MTTISVYNPDTDTYELVSEEEAKALIDLMVSNIASCIEENDRGNHGG